MEFLENLGYPRIFYKFGYSAKKSWRFQLPRFTKTFLNPKTNTKIIDVILVKIQGFQTAATPLHVKGRLAPQFFRKWRGHPPCWGGKSWADCAYRHLDTHTDETYLAYGSTPEHSYPRWSRSYDDISYDDTTWVSLRTRLFIASQPCLDSFVRRETMSLNYSSLMMMKWGSDTKRPSERFCKLLASFFVFSTLGAEKSKLMTLDNTCMISKINCMIFSSSWMTTVCFLAQ